MEEARSEKGRVREDQQRPDPADKLLSCLQAAINCKTASSWASLFSSAGFP